MGYDTQKPKGLLERILSASSNEGSLVCDFFCGSGTTLLVAEKLGRRWIGADLGRWAIHTTRKRILGIENCKPFEILNLGKYERQYWQGVTLGEGQAQEQLFYEYLAFVLKLYKAQPVSGMTHLHGKKGRALVHIGAIDSPVTIDEVALAIEECVKVKQPELHVLGWEWEMGLAGPNNDIRVGSPMHALAKQKGIKLLLIEKLRVAVDAWREDGYPDVSSVTRRLLEYWFEEDHQVAGFPVPFRFHFGQREAIETLIYVVEVLGHRNCKETIRNFGSVYGEDLFRTAGINFQTLPDGTRQVCRYVAEVDREQVQDLPVENLRRHAFKMATGSGKTWVIALCIVWSYYRHQEGKSGAAPDLGLSSNFLIVSPNVIVHQRLERDFDGNRIFNELPLVPPEWGKLNFKVIKRGDFAEPDAGGNLFISNIHQLYEGRDQPWAPATAIEALLGAPVKKDAVKKGRPMLERVKSLRDVGVLNDEAHHVHDSELEWHRSLMAVHNALPGGLALWLDYSATPQQGELIYPWVIVDYPLAQAVEDRIVKAPLIVRHVSGTKVPPHDPTGISKENVCDKYGYWIHAAVERWKVHTKAYKATGLKPVLFIMAEKTGYADVIGKHLVDAHGFKDKEVLVIHTDTAGEITKADLDKARIAANEIDKPDNKIRAIVSVMILKEGWDVRNVSVVLGLRPFGTAILPQQVIGRGLRLMDRSVLGPDRTQTLEVLGTKNLLDTLKANLEAEGVGVGDTGDPPPMPVTITPLQERAKYDIGIPLTKPCLFHNVQKLAGLDVIKMESILNEEGLEEVFRIKLQADFATVEVFVGAPEISLQAKALHETLAYLTNRICDMAKLGGKFAELYPLVATYVEHRCFGRPVEIDPETDEGRKVAEHLTRQDIRESVARRLAHKISTLLVQHRTLEFESQDFKLSDTRPFTWRRNLTAGPLVCTKTVFNYVATYNDFERRFAQFLDKRNSGIVRFAALGTTEQGESNTSFRVDYLKPTGAIGFYYPDWVAVEKTESGETNWIIETKGRVFDKAQVEAKDAAINDWCRRISERTGECWEYVRIDQRTFDGGSFSTFRDLVHAVCPAIEGFRTVVRGIHDDGVLIEAELLELGEHLTNMTVMLDHAIGINSESGLADRLLLEVGEDVHAGA